MPLDTFAYAEGTAVTNCVLTQEQIDDNVEVSATCAIAGPRLPPTYRRTADAGNVLRRVATYVDAFPTDTTVDTLIATTMVTLPLRHRLTLR